MDIDSFFITLGGNALNGGLATAIAGSNYDLYIVESGVTAPVPNALTEQDLDGFAAAGTTVIGYVNVAVTDSASSYWNPAWVVPDDPANADIGTIQTGAPPWLQNNLGTATGTDASGASVAFGPIGDYADPEWRDLVIDQALQVINEGYGGVFLDDVSRYFEAGRSAEDLADPSTYDPVRAQDMMELVIEVAQAVRAVDPDAYIAVNGGVDILGSNSGLSAGAPLIESYIDSIDAFMMEAQINDPGGSWDRAVANFEPSLRPGGVDFLVLETEASLGTSLTARFEREVGRFDGVPLLVPDNSYNLLPDLGGGRQEADLGSSDDDILTGTFAGDVIDAGAGNDILRGGAGADVLVGGPGDDLIFAGLTAGGVGLGDEARFDGVASDYTVVGGVDFAVVTGPDGSRDKLFGVGQLRFDDGTVTLPGGSAYDGLIPREDFTTAERVTLLYEAALDRNGAIDRPGLNFYISVTERDGLSNEFLAADLMTSPEFTQRFGAVDSLSDSAFLSRVYENVLDRAPDPDGLAFYLDLLTDGTITRALALADIATSQENLDASSDILGSLYGSSDGDWGFF